MSEKRRALDIWTFTNKKNKKLLHEIILKRILETKSSYLKHAFFTWKIFNQS